MKLVQGKARHRWGRGACGSLGKVTGLVACTAMVLATAACGAGSAASGDPKGGSPTGSGKELGLSLNGNVEYTKNLASGMLKAMDRTSYSYKGVQANFDVRTELTNVDSLIDQGVDGLVINPNTTEGVLSGVKRAKEQGIPVGLAFWTGPTVLDKYLTTVSFIDSVGIGKELGEWLKANAKPGPTIVVQGVLGQGFSEGIDKGLDESLAGSGFDVMVREQGFFDRNKAIGIVESGLQAHPDTTTIVDYSSVMGNGVSSFLKSNGYDHITHVTVAVDDEMLQWLGTPYLAATDYYSPAESGLMATEGVRAALEGGKPVFKNPVFHAIATKSNIDQLVKEHPYGYSDFADKANIS